MPPLLVALRLGDRGLERATLEILAGSAAEASAVLADHIGSLVPACLALATQRPPGSLVRATHCAEASPRAKRKRTRHACVRPQAVRLAALDLLTKLAALPYAVLYPYRMQVVNDIAAALDDPKRPVRAAAASCRTHWFLLDSK